MNTRERGADGNILHPTGETRVVYPDGTANLSFQRPGTVIDFSGRGPNKYVNFGPASTVGVTVRYDHQECPVTAQYVVMDGEAMMRFVTDETTRKTTSELQDYDETQKFIDVMTSGPITVGSRPNRFAGGGKLVEIAGLASSLTGEQISADVKEMTNPLMTARDLYAKALGIE